ncbi:MAG: type IV pilus secretin PilQ [Candidatus Omnitrophica bacterium]|nr:type IV pilus secretin PilQ [Candidatus Omnitrophota bacterium]
MANHERCAGRRISAVAMICGISLCLTSAGAEEAGADAGSSGSAATAAAAASADLLTLNFKNTDMREVINILAYKSGMNIIAGDDVAGQVSMQLANVTWEGALDVILKTYNYTYKREKNLIRIMSLARAKEEENKIPLETRIIPLNFSDVEKIRDSLSKVLGPRGSIQIDKRTNTLIVSDIPELVAQVEATAISLDSRTPQVLIAAMMVDVKLTDEDRLGVGWDMINVNSRSTLRNEDGQYNNSGSASTTLFAAAQRSAGQFSFNPMYDNFDILGVIDAWQSARKAEILANPRVITLDNQEAKIEILEEIPYIETVADPSGSGTKDTVNFKEAGIKLSVTPHITTGGYISMSVKPEQSFQSGSVLNQPIIETRRAETNLLVRNGQTIVIGGLRKRGEQVTHEQVPVLGSMPVVGMLFRRKMVQKTESELLLFVTPHIVFDPELNDQEKEAFARLSTKKPLSVDERSEPQKIRDWWQRKSRAVDAAVAEAKEKEVSAPAPVARQPTEQRGGRSRKQGRLASPPPVPASAAAVERESELSINPLSGEQLRMLQDLEQDSVAFDKKISTM